PRHDPMAALRQRDFQFFAGSRFFSATGMTMLQAVLAWQVYEISGSALQLGLLGLARFAPSLGLSLVGGAVADTYDRRAIVLASQSVPLACSAVLGIASASGGAGLGLIYGLVLVIALAAAFENPARQALLPSLVAPPTFANAVTVNSTFQQLGFVTGPALGGLMIAWAGVEGAYALHVAVLALAIGTMFFVRPRARDGKPREVSLAAIREGISFVRQRPVLWGVMSLDMFAVVFGGAVALLPIYAEDILGVGSLGYGLLLASFEVGAFTMALSLLFLPPIERTGRALLITVAIFGLMTIVFGLSRSFVLSLAAYMVIGMADQISVVMRQTTIQLATPDELRGRVSSVNMVFIGASNQVGAMESGFVAALTSATFAVVSGGIGCLAVVSYIAAKVPALREYRIPRHFSSEAEARAEAEAAGSALPP
ncbi:MAG: MFS transporter, partial [Dehalococcoidia bacterium]